MGGSGFDWQTFHANISTSRERRYILSNAYIGEGVDHISSVDCREAAPCPLPNIALDPTSVEQLFRGHNDIQVEPPVKQLSE